MGNTYLPSAAANQQWQDQAATASLARRLTRPYVAGITTAEAIAVARQRPPRHRDRVVIIQAPGIPGDAARMNRISDIPACTPIARTLAAAGPPAPMTDGLPAGAQHQVSGRFVKENPPSA